MNELFSFCDDHFKIFVLIWLKLREYYSEAKSKKLSLPFIVKKTSNFLKNIRKQCAKITRFRKIAKFVYFLEIEFAESEKFIDKLQHLALIAEIFELPEPISDIIKHIGLDGGDDLENNVFSKKRFFQSIRMIHLCTLIVYQSICSNQGQVSMIHIWLSCLFDHFLFLLIVSTKGRLSNH